MAFYNKKYTDDCRAWISKNQNLYENTIDNIKSFLELGGLLHIYGVAVDNMPDKSLFLKYEDYKKYVKSYHKLIHSITGVRTLLSRSDSPFSIFSSEEDVVFFCLSWVIHGDFYETLIYQIIACWNKPWTMTEGFLIGGALMLVGVLLQLSVGSVEWEVFAWPVNAIFIIYDLTIYDLFTILLLSYFTAAANSLNKGK